MKHWFFLFLATALLAGCSARTVFVADVDVLSFISAEQLENDLVIPGSIQAFVPDADDNLTTPDGGQLLNRLPLLEKLSAFAVQVSVEVENTGSGTLDVSSEFRLAPVGDDKDIYDGVDDMKLAEASFHLAPGSKDTITLTAELEKGDPAMRLITNEGFRVGMKIKALGTSTAHYKITDFSLLLKQRPFDLIPDNGH